MSKTTLAAESEIFIHRPKPTALPALMLALCLATLAACGGGGKDSTAASSSPTGTGTNNPPASMPAAPTGLTATAGAATVTLKWTASTDATSYNVKRSTTSGGPFAQLAAPASTGYTDSTAANGTKYYYVVSALNAAGESANSAPASATPAAQSVAPAAPANVQATVGDAQVSLTWSAGSGATSYHVKRATASGGPYTQVAAPTSSSYSDTALTNGTTYYYVVSAVNSAGESANSAQVSAKPVAAANPTSSVSVVGLHVSGNKILNGQNQPVPLHGVDKSGTEYECLGGPGVFDGPSDANSVTVLQSWAIDIVRLPVNEDCWLGINGAAVGGSAYQTAIVNYVNLLTAGNIATIIDLQWAAPGTTLSNQQLPMPDSDHAPAFWTSVANTFKSNSTVIFDLFNEPFPDSNQDTPAAWACMAKGGTCPGVSYPVASMASLVNAVRATGSTNIIMVPGVQYSNTLDQWLANKPADPTGNLVASWHSYANQICNNQTCWDGVVKPVMQSVPLIVGELGENDCQDVYINPLMTYLDANGGNYLAWAWDTHDCSSFPSLITDYNGTPTNFGVGFYNHLLAFAGRTPPAPAAIPMFSTTYPFGIAVGSTSQYTASDGTIYYPDVANSGMSESMQFFTVFTTNDAITGTPDPALYNKGRTGAFGTWTINVPNGTYQVTLGMARNSTYNAGDYGQDQTIQGQKVGTCVWSMYSGTNLSPEGLACPQSPTTPAPAVDAAMTVSYTVSVFNQQLTIEPAASFGGGRATIVNTIKVAQSTSH